MYGYADEMIGDLKMTLLHFEIRTFTYSYIRTFSHSHIHSFSHSHIQLHHIIIHKIPVADIDIFFTGNGKA